MIISEKFDKILACVANGLIVSLLCKMPAVLVRQALSLSD